MTEDQADRRKWAADADRVFGMLDVHALALAAARVTDQPPKVQAATFRAWYELLEETVAHDPDDIAPGNLWNTVILLHELVGVGMRSGAIRPIVIHSSGPSSYAHLMFRYVLDPEFDWSGEIQLVPNHEQAATWSDRFVAEIEAATGMAEHEDDERD